VTDLEASKWAEARRHLSYPLVLDFNPSFIRHRFRLFQPSN